MAMGCWNGSTPNEIQLDPTLSPLPRNNVDLDADGNGKITVQELEAHHQAVGSLVPGGLGDYDDILMLTVRNEHEPFVGRMPCRRSTGQPRIDSTTDSASGVKTPIESPLAEVVWFAIENPGTRIRIADDPTANGFFGEPGMRTIYRRTLLIAPWINPYLPDIADANRPGASRWRPAIQGRAGPGAAARRKALRVEQAIAAIIAFQDRYDLSVRLEWDHSLGDSGRWKIMANTLGDLTKRENRFGHYGFRPGSGTSAAGTRFFPYPIVSLGSGYHGSYDKCRVSDGSRESSRRPIQPKRLAIVEPRGRGPATGSIISFTTVAGEFRHSHEQPSVSGSPVRIRRRSADRRRARDVQCDPQRCGPGGARRSRPGAAVGQPARRGRDDDRRAGVRCPRVRSGCAAVWLSLSTDSDIDTVLEPSDAGWRGQPTNPPVIGAYLHADNMRPNGSGAIGTNVGTSAIYPYMGQGAFVDMGYGYDKRWDNVRNSTAMLVAPRYATPFASAAPPWFFEFRALPDVFGNQLARASPCTTRGRSTTRTMA